MKLLALLLLAGLCCTGCSSDGSTGLYSISGRITSSGVGLDSVTVTVTVSGGATPLTATTDALGNYRFSGIANGSYSVSPSKAGYTFTPAARPVVIRRTDETGGDFTAAAAPAPVTIQLPKTGQTVVEVINDDGDLQKGAAWPSPRFVDNGNGTATDTLTGLVWLKDAGCIGMTNWTDALAAALSLKSGMCSLSDGSTGGDWRLPNLNELQSLLDISHENPALPNNPFTRVTAAQHWTATTSPELSYLAWIVYMDMGYITTLGKTGQAVVWPVRGDGVDGRVRLPRTGQTYSYAAGDDGYQQKGAVLPERRFTDNGDGAITDNLTSLVWLKNANCVEETTSAVRKIKRYGALQANPSLVWTAALASGVCGLSDNSSPGDWRVPNRGELQSLMDRSHGNPPLPADHPFENVVQNAYWTSSAFAQPDGARTQLRWIGYFDSGAVNIRIIQPADGDCYTWPVRDLKPIAR